jgi:hypothetical protein
MLRSSLAAEALDIQVQALKAVPVGQSLPESVLQRAVTAARAAGTPRIILPLLEQHLACFEEHQVSPSQLLIKEDASADYHHWLAEYVTFAEAVLPAVRSYEACQRLAAIGEGSALARVCALAEPAVRMDDAVFFLEQVLANALLRPVLLSLTGVQPLAKRVVLQAMKKAPGDRDLHYAATLAEAAAAPGSAAGLWQAYLRRFPEDAPASDPSPFECQAADPCPACPGWHEGGFFDGSRQASAGAAASALSLSHPDEQATAQPGGKQPAAEVSEPVPGVIAKPAWGEGLVKLIGGADDAGEEQPCEKETGGTWQRAAFAKKGSQEAEGAAGEISAVEELVLEGK